MNAVSVVRKAIIALIIAAGGALVTALGAESPGGDSIVAAEWWSIAGLGVTAFGAVFVVPNALTSSQRARALEEYQAARFRRSQGRQGGHAAP